MSYDYKLEFDHRAAVDAAWERARVVTNIRESLVNVPRYERISILLQLVAEIAPDGPPSKMQAAPAPSSGTLVSGHFTQDQMDRLAEPAPESKSKAVIPPANQGQSYRTPEQIAARREKVLKAIPIRDIGIATMDLIDKTGVLSTTIRHDLEQLQKQGFIERLNKSRWKRIENPVTDSKPARKATKDHPKSAKTSELPPSRRDGKPKLVDSDMFRAKLYSVLNFEPADWKEIVERLGLSVRKLSAVQRVKRNLNLLHAAGMAKRVGWARGAKWVAGDQPFDREIVASHAYDRANHGRPKKDKSLLPQSYGRPKKKG